MTEEEYARHVEHQRSLAKAFLGSALDKMCEEVGLDAYEAWRLPNWLEERARRKSIEAQRRINMLLAKLYFGIEVTPDYKIISGVS